MAPYIMCGGGGGFTLFEVEVESSWWVNLFIFLCEIFPHEILFFLVYRCRTGSVVVVGNCGHCGSVRQGNCRRSRLNTIRDWQTTRYGFLIIETAFFSVFRTLQSLPVKSANVCRWINFILPSASAPSLPPLSSFCCSRPSQ